MRIKTSQLIPGCILLNDVIGKTNNPIMSKDTVLTDEHITVLHKFLVEMVDISSKLADGKPVQPELHQQEQENDAAHNSRKQVWPNSFEAQFKKTVERYRDLFNKWQNNAAVDIRSVRQVLIPLFEAAAKANGSAIYTLPKYAGNIDDTAHHSVSVGVLASFLAKKLGYENGECLQIGLAGSLSDCGMAKLDESITTYSASSSLTQLSEIKYHPVYSYRMIEHVPAITQAVKQAALQHHERLDGSGYPFGLTKKKIHMYARIIAICDTYLTMMCAHPGEGQSPFSAIGNMKNDQFTKFDHHVMDVFTDHFATIATGMKVRLSTNQTGEVVFADKRYPARPIVKLGSSNDMLPLEDHQDIHIEAVL